MTRSGINDFRDGGKSVNYVCFLYDYFQAVSSDAWPRKEEILELLSPHLPNFFWTRWNAKKGSASGGKKQNRGERYLKRISATSFGSVFFITSRQSFDQNIESLELYLSGSTLNFHQYFPFLNICAAFLGFFWLSSIRPFLPRPMLYT